MRAKLGLVADRGRDDDLLIADLLKLMADARADYTLAFRGLAQADEVWLTQFAPVQAKAMAWRTRYRARMEGEGDLRGAMDAANPKYVLRNWVAETAIRAVEGQDDTAALDRIFRLVTSPFAAHPGEDSFAQPPAAEFGDLCVSCSS
jgi:uncharacterized protein YdiU (UPF0061 family)